MNVLEKILEGFEAESKLAHKEMRRCVRENPLQFDEVKGYARAMEYVVDTIRSHIEEFLNGEKCFSDNHAFVVKNMTAEQFKELTKNQNSFQKAMDRVNRNKGCMAYEVDSNAMEDAKPISREFIDECAEAARKYRKDTEDNKCSDCSRRKLYQIGYLDGENINTEKIKAINKEMEDYLFEKYCVEGFDEALDGIFKKYLDLSKDSIDKTNENCIDDELKNKIKDMKEADGFVSISDLVDRFVDVDEYYHHEPWNLRQIIANIDIFIPVKKEDLIGDNWIPVEERLPKEEGWYQCTCSDNDIWNEDIVRDLYYYPETKEFVDNIRYENNGLKNIEKYYWTKYVTAWQPLPKQYKSNKQD